MNEKKYLPYAHQSISSEDLEEVKKALAQFTITRGSLVEEFEKAMAAYCGAAYAVAFNSATAGLMAAYAAAETGPSDLIITTPNTFVASVGAGVQCSATPVFVDIERSTGNLNIEQLALNINQPKSRGKTIIVPVHFAGIPVDMHAIEHLVTDPNAIVIEDAAHALGSRYRDGKRVGSCAYSHMTVFSFHPAKTITTGEGGMVLTNDENFNHRLRLFRNNGIERDPAYLQGEAAPWYYEVVLLSGNYNVTEMQAALGLSQLKRLDAFVAKRQKLLKIYKKHLSFLEHVQMLSPSSELFVAPHLCVVQIDFGAYKTTRRHVMQKLSESGIGTQVHYIPVYKHPVFAKSAGDMSAYFPEMEKYYEEALSLPLYADLAEEEVIEVAKALKAILQKGAAA